MSHIIKFPGGVEVVSTTTADAIELLRGLGMVGNQPSATMNGSGEVKSPDLPRAPLDDEIDEDVAKSAVRFLLTIRDAHGGAKTADIQRALAVDNPRAIGSRSMKINKLLTQIGFSKPLVYSNPKKPRIGRTWKPGRKIDAAIRTIDEMLSDG